jgi:UDP-glucose 4-epimerase
MDRRPRLWSVAPATLVALGRLTGQGAAIARLTTSLQVDSSLIRTRLGWSPPVVMIDGLSDVARWYMRGLAKT